MEGIYNHITVGFRNLHKTASRVPQAERFSFDCVRSMALFFVLRATAMSPCTMQEAKAHHLPYYRDEHGRVRRMTKAKFNRFIATISFDLQDAIDLLTSASLSCVGIPVQDLLCLACDETIIATDMADVDSMNIARKPNEGFLIYTTAIRLPLTGKPMAVHVLTSCCRLTARGVPIKENVKAIGCWPVRSQVAHV